VGEQYDELVRKTERLLRSENQQGNLDHQQLLGNWMRILHRIRDPKRTRQGTKYADRLAHKILAVRPDSILELAHSVFDDDDDDTKKGAQQQNAPYDDEFSNVPGYIKEVTRSWAKLGEPETAEALLRHQMETYKKYGRYQPLKHTIAAVINGFARDKRLRSAESLGKALYWFNTMEEPKNIEAYNAVLNAYANRGLAEKADELFRTMKETCPSKIDGFSYSSGMQAWLRSNRHDAQEKIEFLLQDMKDAYEAEGKPNRLLPNSFVYGPAMTLASPQRADDLLRELQDYYDRTGLKSIKPDVRLFAKLMKRWADAGEPKEAEKLLLELTQAYEAGDQSLRPNIHVSRYSTCNERVFVLPFSHSSCLYL
jgi:pentatricopeptide repeat protein